MHKIRFVGDAEMPEGRDFVLVVTADGAMIFYRESAVCPQVLEDSWAAYRALVDAPERRPVTLAHVS